VILFLHLFQNRTLGITVAECPSCHQAKSVQELAVAEMGDRLATVDKSRKVGSCCAPFRGRAGSPSNTMLPGSRLTSVPSGILIHPTIWPQYTNVTDMQGRQYNGPVASGEPLHVTVAQKVLISTTSENSAAKRSSIVVSVFMAYFLQGYTITTLVERWVRCIDILPWIPAGCQLHTYTWHLEQYILSHQQLTCSDVTSQLEQNSKKTKFKN